MKKSFILFMLIIAVAFAYNEREFSMSKEDYAILHTSLRELGFAHCLATFKQDDVVLEDLLLAKNINYKEAESLFAKAFWQANPKRARLKNDGRDLAADSLNVVKSYIRRYIEATIPFSAESGSFNTREVNNREYIASFYKKRKIYKNYFKPCVQMYDSKDFSDEIDRAMQFVTECKGCKSDFKEKVYSETKASLKYNTLARCLVYYQMNNTSHDFSGYDNVSRDMQHWYFLSAFGERLENGQWVGEVLQDEIESYMRATMPSLTKIDESYKYRGKPRYVNACLALYNSQGLEDRIDFLIEKYKKYL